MSNTRLNAQIRKAILNNAIKQTVWVKLSAVLTERSVIAEEVRQLSFGGKLAEVESLVEKAKEIINVVNDKTGKNGQIADSQIVGSSVNANVDGMHINLPFTSTYRLYSHDLKGRYIQYGESECVYKISEAVSHRERIVIKDEDLKRRIMNNADAVKSLEEESTTIISTIAAILIKAQTIQKLIEMWPESEKFIPEDISAASQQVSCLPISISDLNSKIASLAA